MKSSGSCTIYIFCWNNSCPWHWTLASPSEWPQQLVWLPFLMCRLFKGSTVYQCLPRVAVFCVQNCYMLEAMSAGIGVDFAVQVGLIPQCRPWSHLIWAVCWFSGHDAVSPTCDEYSNTGCRQANAYNTLQQCLVESEVSSANVYPALAGLWRPTIKRSCMELVILVAAVSPAGQPQQVRMVVNGFVAAKSKHVCPSEE